MERLHPGQREVLEAILGGRDVLALMPTGSGKSLCYQLPAIFLPRAVVVVSPLIALMQDQQAKAEQAGLAVEKIDSTLSATEEAAALARIDQGVARLIYVTPERLEKAEFLEHLQGCGVSLLAIDEAHCVSQWGHDFRPAYLNLKEARKKLGNPPVAMLTATATAEVIADMQKQLGAEGALVVNTGIERPNLTFAVHHTVNAAAKQHRLLRMITAESGAGIVYTASVRTATELHQWLLDNGVSAGIYHGRLPAKERAQTQASFMGGGLKVLIATKAFGMGIDKADIRFVYHYEFPDSLESYYQEAGRAGRDGLPATAVLLYRLEDRRIQSFFMHGRYPHLGELHAVLEALAPGSEALGNEEQRPGSAALAPAHPPGSAAAIAEKSGVPRRRTQTVLHLLAETGLIRRTRKGFAVKSGGPSDAELAELLAALAERGRSDKDRLDEMMHYAESAACRKQSMRTYFCEEAGEPCGACDNCSEGGERAARLPGGWRQEQVVEVMTAVGEVVTTAPETLPCSGERRQLEPAYQKGDLVRHRKFGPGKVLDVAAENLMVRFDKAGLKTVRTTFVTAA